MMYPFKEDSFAPRNAWYVAAFPAEITRTLLTRSILNEPVLFYRKEDGTPVAVEAICPHRQFPLGSGKLIGDQLQCGYHGITFASDGRCTRIPSQGSVPEGLRIRVFPLVERGLWCWIWPGDPALADEALIPTPAEIGLDDSGFRSRPILSTSFRGRYWLMNENLLDLSHVAYLHRSTLGTDEHATVPEVRDFNPRRLRSVRLMKATEMPVILTHRTTYRGFIDHSLSLMFHAPGLHYHLDVCQVFDGHADRAGEILHESRHWHAVTPSTHSETLYFIASAQRTDAQLDFVAEYIKPILAEDIFAAEEIEKTLQRRQRPAELSISSDATALRARRIIQEMMDSEATS